MAAGIHTGALTYIDIQRLELGDGKSSYCRGNCAGIRIARLDTSAAAPVRVDLVRLSGATLLSR